MAKGCLIPVACCIGSLGLNIFAQMIDHSGVTMYLTLPASGFLRTGAALMAVVAAVLFTKWLKLSKV